jgi:hypothetical protein
VTGLAPIPEGDEKMAETSPRSILCQQLNLGHTCGRRDKRICLYNKGKNTLFYGRLSLTGGHMFRASGADPGGTLGGVGVVVNCQNFECFLSGGFGQVSASVWIGAIRVVAQCRRS